MNRYQKRYQDGFTMGWLQRSARELIDTERRAELNRPLPKNINDPQLLRPTRCRVKRAFFVDGKLTAAGDTVTLQRHDALSLAAIGKVEILKR